VITGLGSSKSAASVIIEADMAPWTRVFQGYLKIGGTESDGGTTTLNWPYLKFGLRSEFLLFCTLSQCP
jgi:hypothetical protein